MKTISRLSHTGDRQIQRKERTRNKLLAAARTIAAKVGVQEVTIADITHTADVGIGTFYLHFQDKDDIFRTLLQQGIAEMTADVEPSIVAVPLEYSLPTAIRAICTTCYKHRDLINIAFSSGTFFNSAIQGQNHLSEYLSCAIDAAIEHQLLTEPVDSQLIARLITGMISQGIIWWKEHDTPLPADMAEQIIRFLRNGLPAVLFTAISQPDC